jgi:hypothetical protein
MADYRQAQDLQNLPQAHLQKGLQRRHRRVVQSLLEKIDAPPHGQQHENRLGEKTRHTDVHVRQLQDIVKPQQHGGADQNKRAAQQDQCQPPHTPRRCFELLLNGVNVTPDMSAKHHRHRK